jgi:DNA-binding response OmpR family regulator
LIARVHALLRRVDRAAELNGGAQAHSNGGTAAAKSPQPLRFVLAAVPAGSNGTSGDQIPSTDSSDRSEGEDPVEPRILEIDHAQRRVRIGTVEAHLTPTEFDLLACLASQPRTVLTRERLLAEVWDWLDASGTRTVDSHVKAVRRKIGAEWIRTVHGVGYALEVSPEDRE